MSSRICAYDAAGSSAHDGVREVGPRRTRELYASRSMSRRTSDKASDRQDPRHSVNRLPATRRRTRRPVRQTKRWVHITSTGADLRLRLRSSLFLRNFLRETRIKWEFLHCREIPILRNSPGIKTQVLRKLFLTRGFRVRLFQVEHVERECRGIFPRKDSGTSGGVFAGGIGRLVDERGTEGRSTGV